MKRSVWLHPSDKLVRFPASHWGAGFEETLRAEADSIGEGIGDDVLVRWEPIGPWTRVARTTRPWQAKRYGGLSRDDYVARLATAIKAGDNVPPLVSWGHLLTDEEAEEADDPTEGFVDGIHRTLAADRANIRLVPVIDLSLVELP